MGWLLVEWQNICCGGVACAKRAICNVIIWQCVSACVYVATVITRTGVGIGQVKLMLPGLRERERERERERVL